jgi:hypothetical protein
LLERAAELTLAAFDKGGVVARLGAACILCMLLSTCGDPAAPPAVPYTSTVVDPGSTHAATERDLRVLGDDIAMVLQGDDPTIAYGFGVGEYQALKMARPGAEGWELEIIDDSSGVRKSMAVSDVGEFLVAYASLNYRPVQRFASGQMGAWDLNAREPTVPAATGTVDFEPGSGFHFAYPTFQKDQPGAQGATYVNLETNGEVVLASEPSFDQLPPRVDMKVHEGVAHIVVALPEEGGERPLGLRVEPWRLDYFQCTAVGCSDPEPLADGQPDYYDTPEIQIGPAGPVVAYTVRGYLNILRREGPLNWSHEEVEFPERGTLHRGGMDIDEAGTIHLAACLQRHEFETAEGRQVIPPCEALGYGRLDGDAWVITQLGPSCRGRGKLATLVAGTSHVHIAHVGCDSQLLYTTVTR